MTTILATLFIGDLRPLPPEGQMSGIFKHPTRERIAVGTHGLEGDRQGDLRHHGGPDKAVHHYPAEHYAAFIQRWPQLAGIALPGVLGENISGTGLNESLVCIGDIYRIGSVVLQVSQPRTPCWKISHRLGMDKASQFVAETGITGWYYRVLEPGSLAAGDTIERIARPNPELTLASYWQAIHQHRPDPDLLERIAAAPGLAGDKAARHGERARWLRQQG